MYFRYIRYIREKDLVLPYLQKHVVALSTVIIYTTLKKQHAGTPYKKIIFQESKSLFSEIYQEVTFIVGGHM